MTADDPAAAYAREQIEKAEHGKADNQCPSCRVYRTDGRHPAPQDYRSTCAYSGINPHWSTP